VLEHWASSRQEVIDTLTRAGGRHVVFVRYGARHSPHVELVWNGPDVDRANVVWVRDIDADQDAKVLEYYRDRKAWLMSVEDDMGYGKIVPWPG
jgi:hypothetical protein